MEQRRLGIAVVVAALLSSTVSGCETSRRPSVAVIGGGAAGLSTAWLLESDCDVTLFEKDAVLGGHADTVYLGQGGFVEAGFEFFSAPMYPHFIQLLKVLNVETHAYPLHYTFRNGDHTIVLPPKDLSSLSSADEATLFAFSSYLASAADLVKSGDETLTVGAFSEMQPQSADFRAQFLYPFLAAMWGVSTTDIQSFAAVPILSYLVLQQSNGIEPPTFYEVTGGTRVYIDAIREQLNRTAIRTSAEVVDVSAVATGGERAYQVTTQDGFEAAFDHVVFATNASVARALIDKLDGTDDVKAQLDKIRYFKTSIAIHGDTSVLPKDPSDWGEVNIAYDGTHSAITVHKSWRNPDAPAFKSWVSYEVDNGLAQPTPLLAPIHTYYHAAVDLDYVSSHDALHALQGKGDLWFAGVYTGNIDSHETAIVSAVDIAQALAPRSSRLKALLQ